MLPMRVDRPSMKKQDLKANLIISGPLFPEPVQVVMTHDMGHLVKVIGKGARF